MLIAAQCAKQGQTGFHGREICVILHWLGHCVTAPTARRWAIPHAAVYEILCCRLLYTAINKAISDELAIGPRDRDCTGHGD